MSQGLCFESDCQPDFLFGRCALLSAFLWRLSGACLCFRLDLLLDSSHYHLHSLSKKRRAAQTIEYRFSNNPSILLDLRQEFKLTNPGCGSTAKKIQVLSRPSNTRAGAKCANSRSRTRQDQGAMS